MCKVCGITKPLTAENFPIAKKPVTLKPRTDTVSYFHHRCRDCACAVSRAYHQANKERLSTLHKEWWNKNKAEINAKRQSCGRNRENTRKYYHEHKIERRIYSKSYAPIRNAKKRADRASNPDKYKELDKKYHLSRKEMRNAQSRKWMKEHPEYHREYYARNAEKLATKSRKWRKSHPETPRNYAKKRRALLAGAAEIETIDRFALVARDGSCCYLCGRILDINKKRELSVDHVVPISRGGAHTMANLKICCQPCNSRKRDRTLEEYLRDYDPSFYPAYKAG